MRKLFIILIGCVAILLAGYAGYRGYGVWKNKHLTSLARQFMAKSDSRNALLCLEQVLRSDPHNIQAVRIMADISDAAHSPGALLWRSRLVALEPHSLNDRLALAQTAIVLHDYATATNTLEGVDPAGKNTVPYLLAAGAAAALTGDPGKAQEQYLEVLKLDPQNVSAQLNLSVIRLHGTNISAVAEARSSLQSLRYNPTNGILRCQALRELAVYALRNHQNNEALADSKQLLQETNSAFQDRLLQLNIMQTANSIDFRPTLATVQQEAAADPAKIYELTDWETEKLSPRDALKWLTTLPSNMQTNQSVEFLTASCYSLLRDWRGLQAHIERQNWSELDFVRHAYLARALRGQDLNDSSKAEWELAVKGTEGQKETLVMLLRLVADWGWLTEGEDILWNIVKRYPGENWAVQSLTQVLTAGGRTRSILELYSEEMKRNPTDINSKNNVAYTALLLGAQELKPYDLAKEVYSQSHTNASYVSTYAFSLYLQGKNTEALKVMQQLKAQELQRPDIAGYYGLILKANGNRDNARAYLNWSYKARLLPEEKKLFDQAKAGL